VQLRIGLLTAALAAPFLSLVPAARAVPSFARQTGMPCTACHTEFPQLTPFGREFKLEGYTMSNGQSKLPPLAAMAQPSFTHTAQGQKPKAAPSFGENDNVALTQASLFYAGRLFGPYADSLFGHEVGSYLDHIGTFVQGTYDGVGHEFAWDNTEVRAAANTTVKGKPVVLGVYANNNPGMQDLWNTTLAWGFPFSSSGLAPTPAAAPLLAGTVAQQVIGGGGYGMLDHLLYLEVGGYSTLSGTAQKQLGVDPEGEPEIRGFAPYWRVAAQHNWGPHYLEVGTYGMAARTFPERDRSEGKDRLNDVGFDAQYQFLSERNDVTVLLNAVHENEDWRASQPLGLATHATDNLWLASASASYLFDKTYAADVQYFVTTGSDDPLLYADSRVGSPNSDGWVFELDWLPLNKNGGPKFWPMSNVKLAVQYTHYMHFDGSSKNFDGTGRSASDNDTLYLEMWLAF
jgi:hypothetical protein